MIDLEPFVGKTVVITCEDGKTREGVIERRDTSTWPYGLWLPDDDDILTYTRDGYYWETKGPSSFNIKSINLKEEEPMIDLEQFVGKTVVITQEGGFTSEALIERFGDSNCHYKLRWPDGSHNVYSRDGYFWLNRPSDVNIKSIKLKEEPPMIDLEQFVGKTVVITQEDGTTWKGVIERTDSLPYPYKLKYSDGSLTTYTRDGYCWSWKCYSPANIKSIKLKDESPVDLQQRLETIQREAELIKQQLAKSYPTLQDANPGDELEDGTVVIEKYGNAALIAAPKTTEVAYKWTPEFTPVFDKLKEHNFNPSQWFIPSQKQLALAYKNAKQYFSSTFYWSSDEASSSGACRVNFNNGNQLAGSKSFSRSVRAFRLVEL